MRVSFRSLMVVTLAVAQAVARPQVLYTSSVSYCAEPQGLVVQEFDVTYFRTNSSIKFRISATSTYADLNATAHILINAYGNSPLRMNFDFCNVLDGVLCPLPQYNFTGNAILPLPPTFKLDIPAIAYKIPDLEAFAQLNLTYNDTGEVAACVQSTLSNGWSTHQPAASSATAAFAVVSLISSFGHSFFFPATSPSVFRVLDIFLLFQHVASSGMLHLNYPMVYTSFTTNFAWSFGLFTDSSTLQRAIDRMRYRTGSSLPEGAQQPDEYSDRRLSPYNLAKLASVTFRGIPSIDIAKLAAGTAMPLLKREFITPPTISEQEDTLAPGIPVYVNYLTIGTGNAFMSVFFTCLFLLLVASAIAAAGYGLARFNMKRSAGPHRLQIYRDLSMAFSLRLVLITYFPVTVMAYFQWTLHDSWAATLLSVITYVLLLASSAYPTLLIIQFSRRESAEELYATPRVLRSLGAFYGMFTPHRFYVFVTYIVVPFIKACFISFGKDHGLVQVIGLVVVELMLFGTLISTRAGHTKKSDALAIFLSIVRIATTAALIPFVRDPLGVSAIPRVAVGLVIAVICTIAIIVLIINFVVNLGVWSLLRRRTAAAAEVSQPRDSSSSRNVDMEKKNKDAEKPEASIPTPAIVDTETVNPDPNPATTQTTSLHPTDSRP